ncbi:MAG: PQQ-binding-like beta-propeller repeat protein, partial [Candidatus Omnitrophica bacterium]|nr:PQQ-binding-like beta-propeller repeat protein [Candidatus Omnitrophota bacterium]
DKVLFGSEDGNLYLVSLAEGKELWKYDFGEGTIASPAVSNGKVVIGAEDGYVYCFSIQ